MTLSFGQRTLFDQAQLTIHEGDRIGLLGLNGQGKSTLFNIITEQVKLDHVTPPFTFDKSNSDFSVLLIPQELDFENFLDLDVSNYFLAFYPELYKIHQQLEILNDAICSGDEKALDRQQVLLDRFEFLQGWDIQSNYESYLKFFGIANVTTKLLSLSGGEQRKLALSVGLSAKERLILWDEPTNHLDIESIQKFEEEIASSQKTFMIISHDRYLLNTIANKIVHIERGKITSFIGTYLDYLDHLELKEQERLKNLETLKNKHRREQAWMRQGIKARGTRSKKRVEGFNNIRSNIAELKSQSKKLSELSLQHSGRKSKQLIAIEEGLFCYDDIPFLKRINISVFKGDKIALIGANGTGKTTLIKIIQEQLKLTTGKFKSLDQLNTLCFDQKRESLDLEKSPIELVGDGMDMIQTAFGEIQINSYLKRFLFTSDQVNRPIKGLSGGEKNRLQLALFMKDVADLWIFDEPTNDLDIETINLLENELTNYSGAIIIIGHDRAFLDNVCKKTWLIYNQEIEMFEGGYSQVAPFLEAMRLENELKEKERESAKKQIKQEPKVAKKLSYKDQQRFDTIEEIIMTTEKEISSFEETMGTYDFNSMDSTKTAEFDKITAQKGTAEITLKNLYAEWEELEKKQQ